MTGCALIRPEVPPAKVRFPGVGAVSTAKLLKVAPEEMLNALSNKKQLKNNP